MNCLVTGGGGFLGRAVAVQLLARGDTVTILGRNRYPDVEALGAVGIVADLADRAAVSEACRERDAVFHVAGKAGVWGPWEEYYRSNFVATRNVVESCLEQRVARLVYTSSASVVFDGSDHEGADESLPYPHRYLTAYSRTKAMAERYALAASGRGGLRVAALRPHLIWGPGDPHLVPRVVQAARSGRLARIGDGGNRVDLTYVDDAARAHLLAADRLEPGSPACGRAYFITQGTPVQLWPWLDGLLEQVGAPRPTRSLPVEAAWALGATLEATYRLLRRRDEPPMTRFVALQLGRSHHYDIGAARRDLGYEPATPMEEGLQRLVRWMG